MFNQRTAAIIFPCYIMAECGKIYLLPHVRSLNKSKIMAVGAILQGVGSIASALSNIGAAKRQVKRQKELMQAQDKINDENYQQQLADQRQLIDEERAYNDFGSVMSRAEAAGVNPLYALGAGSTGGNISTSTPSHGDSSIPAAVSDPTVAAFSTASAGIGQVLDTAIKKQQLKQMELKTEYEKQTLGYRTELSRLVTEGQEATNALSAAMTNKTEKETSYFEAAASYQNALAERTEQLTPVERDKLLADYRKVMADAENIEIRNEKQRDLFDAQIRSMNAATFQALQQGRLAKIEGAFVAQDSGSRKQQAEAAKQQAENQKAYNEALAEYQRAQIAYENDRNDIVKRQQWINAGVKLIAIAGGATVGFFVGGPMGAAVGASIGAGASLGNPFESSLSSSFAGSSRPIGF